MISLSDVEPDKVAVVAVTLLANVPAPLTAKLPVTDTLPVNCCVLPKLFPNILLPLEYTIEEVTC
jgi:hypothetical protein